MKYFKHKYAEKNDAAEIAQKKFMKIEIMKILKTAKNALKKRIKMTDKNHEDCVNESWFHDIIDTISTLV